MGSRHRSVSWALTALVLATIVCSLGLVGLRAVKAAPDPRAAGTQLWTARYDGPAFNGSDAATGMAVSPDGNTVYVTGFSDTLVRDSDFATIAYDADGRRLWTARLGLTHSGGIDIAVSPDGARVFVTGQVSAGDTGDFGTVAYDGATGKQLWFSQYDRAAGYDRPAAIAVAPDGSTVFVTGVTTQPGTSDVWDATTLAYDATTGDQRWVSSYDDPSHLGDSARAIAMSPEGDRVYVTGGTDTPDGGLNIATLAYDASTGDQLWLARYDGPRHDDSGKDIATSPDGTRLFITGSSESQTRFDYVTIAYDAESGTQLWSRREPKGDFPGSLVVSPDGSRVFVTGTSNWGDYLTQAYTAGSGSLVWTATYDDGSGDAATAMAIGPDGARLYVTGNSNSFQSGIDYATVAYAAGSGTQLWAARYDGPSSLVDEPFAIGLSPNRHRVFVTGLSDGASFDQDYLTVSYQT